MNYCKMERVNKKSTLSMEKNTAFLSISVTEEIIKELRKIKSSFCFERFQMLFIECYTAMQNLDILSIATL